MINIGVVIIGGVIGCAIGISPIILFYLILDWRDKKRYEREMQEIINHFDLFLEDQKRLYPWIR